MAHTILFVACLAAAAYQLWRVPRLWAFLLLFIALMPKVSLASVPGNTTPVRIDDLVVGGLLLTWLFGRRPVPASPATFFLLVYWYAAAVATLAGISAISTGAGPCDGSHSLAKNCEIEPLYKGTKKIILLEVALAGVQ